MSAVRISTVALILAMFAIVSLRLSAPDTRQVAAMPQAPDPSSARRGPYMYHGCKVYTPNDWFTTNLIVGGSSYATNAVDANSANIISNLVSTFPGLYIDEVHPGGETTVNLATNSTPTHTVNGATMTGGAGAYGPNNAIPVTNPFYEEGSAFGGCRGDCHAIVLNTQTCIDYETYASGSRQWNGTAYTTGYASVYDLKRSLNSQYANHEGVTAAGLPLLGMTDFGEDASGNSIDHIVEFSLPGSGAAPSASGGRVAPAAAGHTCEQNCTNKLPLGARLRLKAAYPCPSREQYPQSYLVCNQLKTYGMIFVDWNGSSGSGTSIIMLRFGTSINGTNPWRGSDLYPGLKDITIGDFDVMKLGAIR